MAKSSKSKDIIVVSSKVKEYIKSQECLTSSEVVEALSSKVYACLDEAINRANGNGRKTVTAKDI